MNSPAYIIYVTTAPSNVFVYGTVWPFTGGEGGSPQFTAAAVANSE